MKKQEKYKKLDVGFALSKELENSIDIFLNHINYESGTSEDCLRSEIDFWLKDFKDKLTEEQYSLLHDYYVLGGIFENG